LDNNFLLSRFPEDLFPPLAEGRANYYSKTIKGGGVCSRSNVVITGLCRNIIDVLPHAAARLRRTAELFKEAKILIYENDSDDGTTQALRTEFEGENNVILKQDRTGHKMFDKTRELERPLYLGRLRQRCNGWIKDINKFFPIDYIIVIDLDLDGGWSYDGILNSFGYDHWSAMTANGFEYKEKKIESEQGVEYLEYERLFFDTFAYKKYGSWEVLDSEETNRLRFERGEEPFRVYSNFNGVGIYKYEDMIDCVFGAHQNPDGTVINEWSFMHNQMVKRGCNIYLNPSLITLYSPTEYSTHIEQE
jgi:hypothetical protein